MQKPGITEHTMLSEHDASLSDPRTIEMVGRKILERINAFKPDVLLIWGPDGSRAIPITAPRRTSPLSCSHNARH